MVNWTQVLSTPLNTGAVQMFATGRLSGKDVEKVFRTFDRESSPQVTRLIRTHGARGARKVSRDALRRRNLL